MSKRILACDLSWMQNLLRQLGIAARFVAATIILIWMSRLTNYAWVDVLYQELVGWVLDPSHAFLQVILIFQCFKCFDNTMPVSGGIRGSATSNYNFQ
jgi:hypothetical protein